MGPESADALRNGRSRFGSVGVVVIGRNEGERLRWCLESIRNQSNCVIYVDSGSSDESVSLAKSLSAAVVELDLQMPFTAARARNEGFQKLIELQPNVVFVFFVDGDCEVVTNWVGKAAGFLHEHADLAVVCGFRRERFPGDSVYNMLCDIEWQDCPVGEVKFCGGDALIRVDAFRQIKGYRSELICGEEPEMCVRLRKAGWRIWRLNGEMTLHDAAIYRFGQWWRRMLRGGYGFAQGAHLHGAAPEQMWVVESRRAWIWGFCLPIAAIVLTYLAGSWGLLLLSVYPLQVVRMASRGRRSSRENWWRAVALVISKFPELIGQIKYFFDRCRNVNSHLIEYK